MKFSRKMLLALCCATALGYAWAMEEPESSEAAVTEEKSAPEAVPTTKEMPAPATEAMPSEEKAAPTPEAMPSEKPGEHEAMPTEEAAPTPESMTTEKEAQAHEGEGKDEEADVEELFKDIMTSEESK